MGLNNHRLVHFLAATTRVIRANQTTILMVSSRYSNRPDQAYVVNPVSTKFYGFPANSKRVGHCINVLWETHFFYVLVFCSECTVSIWTQPARRNKVQFAVFAHLSSNPDPWPSGYFRRWCVGMVYSAALIRPHAKVSGGYLPYRTRIQNQRVDQPSRLRQG